MNLKADKIDEGINMNTISSANKIALLQKKLAEIEEKKKLLKEKNQLNEHLKKENKIEEAKEKEEKIRETVQ